MSEKVRLRPDAITKIGEKLYGDHWWQASLARKVNISKTYLTRILKGFDPKITTSQPGRIPPEDFEINLQAVLIERIEELTTCLDIPGMPASGSPEMKKAGAMVREAMRLVERAHPGISS